MQNIRKITSRRRRLITSTVAAFAAVGAAAVAAVSIPAHAATATDFRSLTFQAPARVKSIAVTGTGHARWRVGGDQTGEVGSIENPVSLDSCYTYNDAHNGARVSDGKMYIYTNQAPGRQDPTRVVADVQTSFPLLLAGSAISVNTFASENCTSDLVKQFTDLTIPTERTGNSFSFDLDLN